MKTDKELYRQLRELPLSQLWKEEVPRYEKATPRARNERVALIRAVGVVVAAHGTAEERKEVRAWLTRLLQDPSEKVRRYAMAALPKVGAGRSEEAELLSLLKGNTGERETKFVGRALDKIGGAATLDAFRGAPGLLRQTEQKVKASIARRQSPSAIRMERVLAEFADLRIHLRCRKGLETIVRDEVLERTGPRKKFRVAAVQSRLVVLAPVAPFSLADLFAFRCFGTAGFLLDTARGAGEADSVAGIAAAITSPRSRRLLEALTEGSIRYRLDFVSKGHQRGAVHSVVNRAYARCPEILNDARDAPWAIDVHPTGHGASVELRPKLAPDPRFYYRLDDVPAASHPPLAACMARLAKAIPFGSGSAGVPPALDGVPPDGIRSAIDSPACPTLHPNRPSGGTPLEAGGTPALPGTRPHDSGLAGRFPAEIVWDPFCGSGSELIECALLGGVKSVHGTDVSPEAIAIAQANVAAAKLPGVAATFTCCDFRDFAQVPGLGPEGVTLILTNPPMGRRIRIRDMRGLFEDFFAVAAAALQPGGRLVFANPLRLEPRAPSLKLQFRQVVDLGGFDCRLEVYRKFGRISQRRGGAE